MLKNTTIFLQNFISKALKLMAVMMVEFLLLKVTILSIAMLMHCTFFQSTACFTTLGYSWQHCHIVSCNI